jgi:bla regulator protein blaR1
MIPERFSSVATSLAPIAANHLWQSTLVVLLAALLTQILRKNQARARYWIWLLASLKFLLPFSLLTEAGSHLTKPRQLASAQSGLYIAVDQVSQPFTRHMPYVANDVSASHSQNLGVMLPTILAAIWICGVGVVFAVWSIRWLRISRMVREALPLSEGREMEALFRVQNASKTDTSVRLLLVRDMLEPGLFGIRHPVVLWPKGISEHLEDAHIEAILDHELQHVRHRDNLTAAIHMVVEALFWFHPLIWWIGSQLVEERERACDEEVLQLGNKPRVYAESILKTCEFCVESPLTCMSGVTGADLKNRIVRIMTRRLGTNLTSSRKMLLTAVGVAVVIAPVLFGLANAPQVNAQSSPLGSTPSASFEVVSIKPSNPDTTHTFLNMSPGKFSAMNTPVKSIIEFAYNLKSDDQLAGFPSWVSTTKFDIEAKEESVLSESMQKLPPEERVDRIRAMVRSLLADRYSLKVSHQTKELPVYALVIAKGGSKLTETSIPEPNQNRGVRGSPGRLTGMRANMNVLTTVLSHQPETGGRTIIDKTGLTGTYDWDLKWMPETNASLAPSDAPAPDPSSPSFFTAIQEQLGLKLEPQKAPVDILVVDRVEQPSAN